MPAGLVDGAEPIGDLACIGIRSVDHGNEYRIALVALDAFQVLDEERISPQMGGDAYPSALVSFAKA